MRRPKFIKATEVKQGNVVIYAGNLYRISAVDEDGAMAIGLTETMEIPADCNVLQAPPRLASPFVNILDKTPKLDKELHEYMVEVEKAVYK